jgi:hypothetical protein
MNRRTALYLSLLLGGLLPRGLLAQSPGRRTASRSRGTALEPARPRRPAPDDPGKEPESQSPDEDSEATPNLPGEPGQKWQKWDIRRYTSGRIPHTSTNPQNAIVEWILRRTGTATWHGEKIAVLSAGRTQLRAYHDDETLKMVDEVVERFVQAQDDILAIRVRIIRTDNTRWRYPVFSMLTPVPQSGPQGQQIWTMKVDVAAHVLAQMQVQGHKMLVNQRYEMVNGQTLKVETTVARGYVGGLQRENNAGLGAQPRADQLLEGVSLRLSPLLTFDGDALDAAIELTTNTVRSFHRTRLIAPRDIGPSELSLDVPEVSETRLNQTVKSWPLEQTLLISAGIQPGILDDNKNGFLNLRIPGTVPTTSELLVFLDVETVNQSRKTKE